MLDRHSNEFYSSILSSGCERLTLCYIFVALGLDSSSGHFIHERLGEIMSIVLRGRLSWSMKLLLGISELGLKIEVIHNYKLYDCIRKVYVGLKPPEHSLES